MIPADSIFKSPRCHVKVLPAGTARIDLNSVSSAINQPKRRKTEKALSSNSTSPTSSRSLLYRRRHGEFVFAPEIVDRKESVAVVGQRELFTVPIPFDENAASSVPERDASIAERFGCVAARPSVKDRVHIDLAATRDGIGLARFGTSRALCVYSTSKATNRRTDTPRRRLDRIAAGRRVRASPELHQSARMTIIGLTRPARHAGTAPALTVTTNNTTAAAINTIGSRADVSNNIDCTSGAARIAIAIPIAPPTAAIFTASRTTRRATPPVDAA